MYEIVTQVGFRKPLNKSVMLRKTEVPTLQGREQYKMRKGTQKQDDVGRRLQQNEREGPSSNIRRLYTQTQCGTIVLDGCCRHIER